MTLYKFLVGFVLTVAMLCVLGASALLFATRDFQYGLAQLAPATHGLIDDAKLANADATVALIERNEASTQLVHDIADIESRAHVQAGPSVAANVSSGALGARVQTLANQSGLSPQDQTNLAAMRNQIAQLAVLEQHAAAAPPIDTNADSRGVVAAQLLSTSPDAQQALLQEYQGYAGVSAEVQALHTLSPWGIGSTLAHGHPAQLSIALVMLMGALGALLYLFPAYLTRPVPVTMAEIAVRLIFGMCAALAFYVLANAGVAAFALSSSSQSAATTSASLNPFTVSLIGIIAGVLAEDIAKWIQDRGRGIFQQGGPAATQAAQAVDAGFTGVNPHGGPNAP